jgi:hypothetical protein
MVHLHKIGQIFQDVTNNCREKPIYYTTDLEHLISLLARPSINL